MSTAEHLVLSISQEQASIHILLWEDQEDLVRALIVLYSLLPDQIYPLAVSNREKSIERVRQLAESRSPVTEGKERSTDVLAEKYWILFVQQASSKTIGPWLNGWRHPLSTSPGSLLVVRRPDFLEFQNYAPDLVSYAGARIHDASTMLSSISAAHVKKLRTSLPDEVWETLDQLPGRRPPTEELQQWIDSLAPDAER